MLCTLGQHVLEPGSSCRTESPTSSDPDFAFPVTPANRGDSLKMSGCRSRSSTPWCQAAGRGLVGGPDRSGVLAGIEPAVDAGLTTYVGNAKALRYASHICIIDAHVTLAHREIPCAWETRSVRRAILECNCAALI